MVSSCSILLMGLEGMSNRINEPRKAAFNASVKGLPFAEESVIPERMKGLSAAERSTIISKRLLSSKSLLFATPKVDFSEEDRPFAGNR
ncbi:hypothetical protein KSD_46980 [Ktedonobacter sp. SOSP1-85]|nr:hypothetical protein KSD_46980 [Ktedonobacter sp. SOSP1-85]